MRWQNKTKEIEEIRKELSTIETKKVEDKPVITSPVEEKITEGKKPEGEKTARRKGSQEGRRETCYQRKWEGEKDRRVDRETTESPPGNERIGGDEEKTD